MGRLCCGAESVPPRGAPQVSAPYNSKCGPWMYRWTETKETSHLGHESDATIFIATINSPVLQSARPRAVDSGEAKMRTASRENVDKQMPRNLRNNTRACFKLPKNVDKTTSH